MVNQDSSNNRSWVLGVDCGEQKHRFVLMDEFRDRRGALWVDNRMDNVRDGLTKMLVKLPEGCELEIVTEGLRSIGGILVQAATQLGVRIFSINPKALENYRSAEGQPRKDDDRDAELLAKMRLNRVDGCRLALDTRSEERVLCRLTRLRTQLVSQRRQGKNRIRSRLLELSPEVVDPKWAGPFYCSTGMFALLKRWPGFEGMEKVRVSTVERVLRPVTRQGDRLRQTAQAVLEMARRITLGMQERHVISMELDMAIRQQEVTQTSLVMIDQEIKGAVEVHSKGKALLEMPGVGQFTAGVLIGEVLPLARNQSEGKAATYAGITPLSRRSGKSEGRSKLARGVNKHAVRAVYLSAVSARQCSALDDAYYQKQLQRHKGHPKPHVKSFLSLARQRFKVMYKILTSEIRYDKETLIRSHLKRQELERTPKNEGLTA